LLDTQECGWTTTESSFSYRCMVSQSVAELTHLGITDHLHIGAYTTY